jgi:hypothetical protein
LAGGVAHRLDLFGQLGAEAIAGQANDTRAVDRAVDLPWSCGRRT